MGNITATILHYSR